MRLILLLLLASIFGYSVLQIDKIDPDNYVKIYIAGYLAEVKVLGFILICIGLTIAIYFSLWVFRTLWRSPKTMSKWLGRRNHDKAEQQFGAGYLSMIKGDWRKAENLLLKKSSHSGIAYVNFLAAAQAAQEQGNLNARDDYLKEAYKAAPNERLAIGLTKAKLHQRAGQMEEALATLEDLKADGVNNPQYTAMLLQTHEENENWKDAEGLLLVAKKQKALPEDVLTNIQNKIYAHALRSADDVDKAWQELPKPQKKVASNVVIYAQSLLAKNESAKAEKIITSTLKNTWSDSLVNVYGTLNVDKPLKSLRRVEGWLMARPENAELNLAAGRLAASAKDYETAKKYLQTAISLGQLPQAYAVLGAVFEESNDSGKALQLYRSGMQSIANSGLNLNDKKLVEIEELEPEENDVQEGELV